jgi:hypothetical protein
MPITLNGDTGITTPSYGGAVAAEYLVPVTGFKNRIINGDMRIDQRNAGLSVTPVNAQYVTDRWQCFLTAASKFTEQQNAGSVTPPVGFTNYLGITSSSAYSITSTDVFTITQPIEGFNTADLAWGTANAATVTLSFWVRSSLTGTFGGCINNGAANRAYPFTYTISAANTWEQKSVTIAGDTTGTWLNTTGLGIRVQFGLGVGSTASGTAGAWTAGNLYSATGAVSVVGTNGATFYITGVQLEKGSTATSFDYRPYGTELQLCYRYFEKSYNTDVVPSSATLVGMYSAIASGGSTGYAGAIPFRVPKRAAPTMSGWTYGGTAGSWNYGVFGASEGTQTVTFTDIGFSSVMPIQISIPTGQNGMYGHWTASAEL